ncbi:MAG: hypothetical protein O7F72_09115 [Proteobacteria bacterium]|nr:hypothetical protein [Pseudomonadota bacterium]
MIGHQIALIRRELWEHRSIFVTPIVIGALLSLAVLMTGGIAADFPAEVDQGIVVASNLATDLHRSALVNGLLFVPSIIIFVGMSILVIFYSLDSLFAERKDKSILFWRSLPITDAETVISKALTAAVAIPLVAFAVMVATQLISLVLMSIWIMVAGGNAVHLIWAPVSLISVWATTIVGLLALSLWLSPFLGWFLFVSAFAKRMPLLLAALPIIVIPMIEARIGVSQLFFNAFLKRTVEPGLINEEHVEQLKLGKDLTLSAEVVDPWAALDLSGFISNPNLWAGLAVCAIFTTAAIYVRRYRDDS